MTGIFLLAIISLWAWLAFKLSQWMTNRLQSSKWRGVAASMLFIMLLPLPIADEIIGSFQFKALCREGARLRLHVDDPSGRTARINFNPANRELKGKAVRILHTHVEYHDVADGSLIAEYDGYLAEGGLFIRLLGISEADSPLIIHPRYCSPEKGEAIHRTLGFSVIN